LLYNEEVVKQTLVKNTTSFYGYIYDDFVWLDLNKEYYALIITSIETINMDLLGEIYETIFRNNKNNKEYLKNQKKYY
jgi:hypothetical protein